VTSSEKLKVVSQLEDVVEKGIVALKENAEHEIKILVRPSRQAV
jgi:hypothetical protein